MTVVLDSTDPENKSALRLLANGAGDLEAHVTIKGELHTLKLTGGAALLHGLCRVFGLRTPGAAGSPYRGSAYSW